MLVKITDTGEAPLMGRQEEYWLTHIVPKYNRLRPGMKHTYKPAEEIMVAYGFRAFEYGHWTTQNERFDFLAAGSASYQDLKSVTGIKSLGHGIIGVAFGARGKGGFAAAHFEPASYMINLTRRAGYTCFAHEYGHAIDYFYGHFAQPDSVKYSLSGGRNIGNSGLSDYRKSDPGSLRGLMETVLYHHMFDKGEKSETYKRLEKGALENDYWYRHTEIFARLFEQWVQYKMEKKGIQNYFLTQRKYEDSWAYLSPKEFARLLPHLDKLIRKVAATKVDNQVLKTYKKKS